MYYQLFVRSRKTGKVSQISCDSWQEVQVEIDNRDYPKFVDVEYYDESGFVGSARKVRETRSINHVGGGKMAPAYNYRTWKKRSGK